MPGLAPAGDLLFFASPKKPKEKKGDPQPGPLCGSLKKLKVPENLETSLLRSRRTSKFFNPSLSTFSSPARTGLGDLFGLGFGEPASAKRLQAKLGLTLTSFPHPVLAGLRSAEGSGNKFLDVRRLRSRLVSKNSAAFEHRKLPEAELRDPGCGSPFLCLLSFGEAKESELPPGNPRQSHQR